MDFRQNVYDTGVVAICRRVYGEELMKLSDALYEGGVRLMEVTFDQSDPDCLNRTGQAISQLISRHGDMSFGAGTVLTESQLRAAKAAGGQFVVSPNTNPVLIRLTKELGMGSIPGAMTPSEIICAHESGADIVKLFPAASLGVAYIKDIRAPINHVPLMATGGVSLDNFADFLKVGCCSAGIGSYLSDKKLIAEERWDELRQRAESFYRLFREART